MIIQYEHDPHVNCVCAPSKFNNKFIIFYTNTKI